MSTIDPYCTNGLSPPVRWPSRDPHVPHPGLRYYQGQWRTEAAITRKLATRTDNDRRVGTTWMTYVGMAPSVESAAHLNGMSAALRERQADERRLLTENLADKRQEP